MDRPWLVFSSFVFAMTILLPGKSFRSFVVDDESFSPPKCMESWTAIPFMMVCQLSFAFSCLHHFAVSGNTDTSIRGDGRSYITVLCCTQKEKSHG